MFVFLAFVTQCTKHVSSENESSSLIQVIGITQKNIEKFIAVVHHGA
jgi:hypothetical protein